MAKPAVFLDRDGTINVEKNYLHLWSDWEWLPGSIDAIRAFNDAGSLVVVVTNQAGIARGFYSAADVDRLHRQADVVLAQHDARIDRYYYCPHHPEYGTDRSCDCRKPKPGMLLRAQQDLDIDLRNSWIIGDKLTDIKAGQAVNVRGVLVGTGYGAAEYAQNDDTTVTYADTMAAARQFILTIS